MLDASHRPLVIAGGLTLIIALFALIIALVSVVADHTRLESQAREIETLRHTVQEQERRLNELYAIDREGQEFLESLNWKTREQLILLAAGRGADIKKLIDATDPAKLKQEMESKDATDTK